MEIKKRILTPEQALNRLMGQCSKAERCSHDAVNLLYRWGVPPGEHAAIIGRLTEDRYIDDRRYAEAFVRDKVNYSGWGASKIRQALLLKRVDKSIIAEVLEQIDGGAMNLKMEKILSDKLPKIKAKNGYELRGKLLQFGLSRGFSYEQALPFVEKLTRNLPEAEAD